MNYATVFQKKIIEILKNGKENKNISSHHRQQ